VIRYATPRSRQVGQRIVRHSKDRYVRPCPITPRGETTPRGRNRSVLRLPRDPLRRRNRQHARRSRVHSNSVRSLLSNGHSLPSARSLRNVRNLPSVRNLRNARNPHNARNLSSNAPSNSVHKRRLALNQHVLQQDLRKRTTRTTGTDTAVHRSEVVDVTSHARACPGHVSIRQQSSYLTSPYIMPAKRDMRTIVDGFQQ